ncbi:MAG: NTP transferase domain-containing protein [Bdellovibrionota bacterium]
MKPIIEKDELTFELSGFSPERWTAVIPVAGKGSRLGYNAPKVLYPIAGETILSIILSQLAGLVERVVFVVSPSGREPIAAALEDLGVTGWVDLCVQETPRGMGDAIACAKDSVRTPSCLVIWGDQVTIRRDTLRACLAAHELRGKATLTLPTIMRRKPYIHFVRDTHGRITKVQQQREGEISVAVGENDCGIFCFASDLLFQVLESGWKNQAAIGAETRELNLLPLLPQFERGDGSVVTLRIATEEETLGVNSVEDAMMAESILRTRRQS